MANRAFSERTARKGESFQLLPLLAYPGLPNVTASCRRTFLMNVAASSLSKRLHGGTV
jgi:hypothetical protein